MPWKYVAFPNLKPHITKYVFACFCFNTMSSMTLTIIYGHSSYLVNCDMSVIDKQMFSHLLDHMPSKLVIGKDI
jgi:hypothetical protein